MHRTLVVCAATTAVVAIAWLRLEQPGDRTERVLAIAVLALVPALAPRLRVVAVLVTAVLAARVAFAVSLLHPWRFAPHFANGFLDFYDVRTPFDPRLQADMRGVVLSAVFGFALATAVAVAGRRALLATLVFLVGAGWPATLRGPNGALPVGVAMLVVALVVLTGLSQRRVPRAVLPVAAALALAALAASTSSAVAKNELVSWQHWDFYTAPQPPVSVAFVWNAQYDGIDFPRRRTVVLEVKAPARSVYWRADVLDAFAADRWQQAGPRPGDALEPAQARAHLVRQDVRVLALSGTRLVGASIPLRFDAGEAPVVSRVPGIATLPSGLARDLRYSVWSYAPQLTASQLNASRPRYPRALAAFREVWPSVTMPAFGVPGRAQRVTQVLDAHPELERYLPLEHAAAAVAAGARTPYAAAVALDLWFRSTGGFRYTNHPAVFAPAPLVGFVAQTRAGYCQYFAGAMALMLRYLGVPARVAVGFSSGRYDARRGVWSVTDHDAHAWVEAWFRGYGWVPFDPTPQAGRPERGELSAPYVAAPPSVGPVRSVRVHGRGAFNPRQSTHRHGDQVLRKGKAQAAAQASHEGSLLALLALLIGAIVAGVVGTKLALRRVRYLTRDPRRIAAACRSELAAYLLDQRIDAARSATLHELGELVRYELAVEPDAFVAAATAARFGRPEGAAFAAQRARGELRLLVRALRRRLTARERVRGVLSLRSLGFAP